MKVQFKPIMTYKDTVFQAEDMENGKLVSRDLTMKEVFVNSLNYRDQGEKQSPSEAMKIWATSMKIMAATDSVDLEIDEIKKIKDNLPKAYRPVIAGQVISYLEGLTVKEKDDGAK